MGSMLGTEPQLITPIAGEFAARTLRPWLPPSLNFTGNAGARLGLIQHARIVHRLEEADEVIAQLG